MNVAGQPASDAQAVQRIFSYAVLDFADARTGVLFKGFQIRRRAGDRESLEQVDAEYMAGADFVDCFYAFGKTERAGHLCERADGFDNRLPVRVICNAGYQGAVDFYDVGMNLYEPVYVGMFAAEIIDDDEEAGGSVPVDKCNQVVGRMRPGFNELEADMLRNEAHLTGYGADMGRIHIVAGADYRGIDIHEQEGGRGGVERSEVLQRFFSAKPVELVRDGLFARTGKKFARGDQIGRVGQHPPDQGFVRKDRTGFEAYYGLEKKCKFALFP